MATKQIDNNITAHLGIEKLSKAKAKKIMAKIEDNIQRKVALEVLGLLKKEDQKKVEKLIEEGDNEKISSFLLEKNPVMDSLVKAVAVSIVNDFRESIGNHR